MELLLYYIWTAIKFLHKDSVFEIDMHQNVGSQKYFYELTEFMQDGRRRIYKAKYDIGTPQRDHAHLIAYFKAQIDSFYAVDSTLESIKKLIISDALKERQVYQQYMHFCREIHANDDRTFERFIAKKNTVPYEYLKIQMFGDYFNIELKKHEIPLKVAGLECPFYYEISKIKRGERVVLPRKIHLEIADEYFRRHDFLLERIGRLIDAERDFDGIAA